MRGRPFEPGSNSHTGEPFSRGPDLIPRKDAKLMMMAAWGDRREDIYEGFCHIFQSAKKTPFAFLKAVELYADRLHGKPKQPLVAKHRALCGILGLPRIGDVGS